MNINKEITRRTFIQDSSALISTAFMVPALTRQAPKYKMGLQLFSIRDAMKSDVAGTLKKIAAMGYQDLETYGFVADQMEYYGLKAAVFKGLLEQNQLTTSSGHYDFSSYFVKPADDMKRFVDQCIAGAHALQQRYITWPWLAPEFRTLEKFKLLTEKLNAIGDQVTKGGLGFAYHNHDFEFTDHGGENGYEIIMTETDPALVKLQIDLYWVMHSSKLSPAELFKKQPGRFVMWHIKDMDKVSRDYTELGNGSIDYKVILPHAVRAGLQLYFLEQGGNFKTSSMQSVEESARFFKQNLQQYL